MGKKKKVLLLDNFSCHLENLLIKLQEVENASVPMTNNTGIKLPKDIREGWHEVLIGLEKLLKKTVKLKKEVDRALHIVSLE